MKYKDMQIIKNQQQKVWEQGKKAKPKATLDRTGSEQPSTIEDMEHERVRKIIKNKEQHAQPNPTYYKKDAQKFVQVWLVTYKLQDIIILFFLRYYVLRDGYNSSQNRIFMRYSIKEYRNGEPKELSTDTCLDMNKDFNTLQVLVYQFYDLQMKIDVKQVLSCLTLMIKSLLIMSSIGFNNNNSLLQTVLLLQLEIKLICKREK
ncbi:Hypothetical_protein [Hexamita inflata]|uniref:Hypothetical_protein n=1 Tax=Hexamita inflata TaxID=28002 RepID=A0ABP1GW63_9EUKA